MATAIEAPKVHETRLAGLTLCRCVDFITGESTSTFLANPARQDECFARAREAVGVRPGHWDIQWQDGTVAVWARAGLSFTVANGRHPGAVISLVAPVKGCAACETRQRYDRATCEAASKLKHAGLEYLATEIDWSDVLTRYGRVEAQMFVESLARESDEYAVAELVREFYAAPEPDDC